MSERRANGTKKNELPLVNQASIVLGLLRVAVTKQDALRVTELRERLMRILGAINDAEFDEVIDTHLRARTDDADPDDVRAKLSELREMGKKLLAREERQRPP